MKPDKPPVLPLAIPEKTPNIISENNEDPSEPEIPERRIRKPTAKLKDIIEGRAITSNLPSAPKFTAGTQLPSITDVPGQVLEGEGTADWITLMEDAMAVQTSKMEALEPPSLASMKKSADWLQWEKAIHEELAILKVAGTWEMVDTPDRANLIGSKWVFQAKKDAAGVIASGKLKFT